MTQDRIEPLIQRLLGPAAAEIGCDKCFDELDRYVELQLHTHDAEQAVPGMSAHLAGCPACNEDYESLYALVSQTSTADSRSAPASAASHRRSTDGR